MPPLFLALYLMTVFFVLWLFGVPITAKPKPPDTFESNLKKLKDATAKIEEKWK